MSDYRVIKRNKRLWIECVETGECIYTPPDFLRPHIRDRQRMVHLADQLTAGAAYIAAVVDFESNIGRKK